jgi:HEAT repeats
MGKRGRILITVTAVVLIGVVGWSFFRVRSDPPEPMYKGKPLSYWLEEYHSATTNGSYLNGAQSAILAIGTNAIPTLLRGLRVHDSPLICKLLTWASSHRVLGIHYLDPWEVNYRAALGFEVLGSNAAIAVPDLMRIFDQNITVESKCTTALALGYIGPEADAAVPSLIRAAEGGDAYVRQNAIRALGYIGGAPETVIPVLIRALHDPFAENRGFAAFALGEYKGAAKSAVPALVALFNDSKTNSNSVSYNLHIQAGFALIAIDRETYWSIVTNEAPGSAH